MPAVSSSSNGGGSNCITLSVKYSITLRVVSWVVLSWSVRQSPQPIPVPWKILKSLTVAPQDRAKVASLVLAWDWDIHSSHLLEDSDHASIRPNGQRQSSRASFLSADPRCAPGDDQSVPPRCFSSVESLARDQGDDITYLPVRRGPFARTAQALGATRTPAASPSRRHRYRPRCASGSCGSRARASR